MVLLAVMFVWADCAGVGFTQGLVAGTAVSHWPIAFKAADSPANLHGLAVAGLNAYSRAAGWWQLGTAHVNRHAVHAVKGHYLAPINS